VKISSETRLCDEKKFRTGENEWTTMRANTAETAIVTILTSTPLKYSVQPVMDKAKIPLLTHFGTVKATTELAKNATACAKH
jgi:hypothetical protein